MKRNLIQLAAYVLLNILVSATTVLFVLLLWDQRGQPTMVETYCPPLDLAASAAEVADNEQTASAQLPPIPPLEETVLEIEIIYGAGYVQDEQVVVRHVGEGDLELRGWWLEDEDGNRFPFPVLTMKPNSMVQINSRGGADTAMDLFWSRAEAIWRKGETARIYDPMGNLRAQYLIP
ncbi:MAG: lamin tail domain-containing protein [Anaerolineaceae bacterium]|nr:lamin tail domain-containing protein [Anaerolineaceae bacterium]